MSLFPCRSCKELNRQMNNGLGTAIAIFTNRYPKIFLHQLVSGQLDVDRMDYLNRDSFFTGVSEGVIGYDRIIHMLTVHEGELMVQEKGIYSIEKFLVARRLMYWQVYLHKTVVSAESMLVKIIQRAREKIRQGEKLLSGSESLDFFLSHAPKAPGEWLETFSRMDDNDILSALKKWMKNSDPVMSGLSTMLINRRLLKARLQAEPFDQARVDKHLQEAAGSCIFPIQRLLILFSPVNIPIQPIIRMMKKSIFFLKTVRCVISRRLTMP